MLTPHQNFPESFPELKEAYHYLKMNDHHFQHLLKEYEKLDEKVLKVFATRELILSDFEIETIKKERLALKDSLYHLMLKHQSTEKA